MAIEALALLHVPSLTLPQGAPAIELEKLEDATLVHTGASFAQEPEELLAALLAVVGPQVLAQHDDTRGVLFIPSVAAPKARSYEQVVDEVGEGGVWAALEQDVSAQFGELGALLGNVMSQLPPDLMNAASTMAMGGGGSLEAMAAQVQALLGSSPALQALVGELQRDPKLVESLTQNFLAGHHDDDEQDR